MRKKLLGTMMCAALTASLLAGCSGKAAETTTAAETTAATEAATEAETTTEAAMEAETEAEEEEDTGDASMDNTRNQDEIGDNELLVVSFGTSYNDSRRLTIGAIENAMEEAFPDYSVRRGFTSQIIIDHVKRRDDVTIDNVGEALNRAIDNGVKNLVVQPTHLMNGLEYADLSNELAEYADAFEKKNTAYFGRGLVFNKFTGSRGKSGSNDANAEYLAKIRGVMDDADVSYQFAELGKVDAGGGGTIAYIMANYGMEVIDSGVAVLSMHAPWEVTSKADVYEAYKGYVAFLKNMQYLRVYVARRAFLSKDAKNIFRERNMSKSMRIIVKQRENNLSVLLTKI